MKPLNKLSRIALESYIDDSVKCNIKLLQGFLMNKTPGLIGTRKYLLWNVEEGIRAIKRAAKELRKRR